MVQTKRKILIVDDEPELINSFSEILETDYQILTAANGKIALTLALSEKPDAVLSDINMPIMDGLALLKELRKVNCMVPVIFMTGFTDAEKIRKAWKEGAFDFLDKPVDFSILQSILKNAIHFGGSVQQSQPSAEKVKLNLELPKALVDKIQSQATLQKLSLSEWVIQKLGS